MTRFLVLATSLLLSALPAIPLFGQSTAEASPRWVATWSTAQDVAPTTPAKPHVPPGVTMPDFSKLKQPANRKPAPEKLQDQTIRVIAHTSIAGRKLRVELSNAFGSGTILIAKAHVALRRSESTIDPATDRALTFGGSNSVALAPGMVLVSDPVSLSVPAFADVAVSLFVHGSSNNPANHMLALHTGYISHGDQAAAETMQEPETTLSYLWLRALDVEVSSSAGVVVCLGDSITDGFSTSLDKNLAWPTLLAQRLAQRYPNRHLAVANEGISGNQVLGDGAGVSALARFDRDVASIAGARWVVLLEGINDININGQVAGPGSLTAEELIAGYRQLIARAHVQGLRILGATLTPEEGVWLAGPVGEGTRQKVNDWIRTGRAFDAVVDFDKALRDPAHPSHILTDYDSGDHIHPNDAGNLKMAEAFDLTAFSGN